MAGYSYSSRGKRNSSYGNKREEKITKKDKHDEEDSGNITIHISYHFNIANKDIQVDQRAEGGGQINKHVGTNANQGGQNAKDHSQSGNDHSDFADGNGRSGIAGNDNDEAGGQQGIKIRDSIGKKNLIESSYDHSESSDPPEGDTEGAEDAEENN